jgi:sugar (pentulose or hexulose) kinase
MPASALFVGVDMGTSGCRAIAIDAAGSVTGQVSVPLESPQRHGREVTQDPAQWWRSLTRCLATLGTRIAVENVSTLSVAGTSGTLVLCDSEGSPLGPALLYNDARAAAEAARIRDHAPPESGAHGATSGLAKLLWLLARGDASPARLALHQTDWLCGRMTGVWGMSDYNNALKLGYDPVAGHWPGWLWALDVPMAILPRVVAPGDPIGRLLPEVAATTGLPDTVVVRAGTTDGVAGFLAAGADRPGQGVTSLGSTLILKLLSRRPVFSPQHGVYSHRLGGLWLAGGASNAGGAVLRQHFTDAEMDALTPELDPEHPTGLDYYPLPAPGERFPVNDPELAPRLTPPAPDRRTLFQALLESLTRIEAEGYRLLAGLGGPGLTEVRTVGGGAHNPAWTALRTRALNVPVVPARSEHPAFGAALLAADGLSRYRG